MALTGLHATNGTYENDRNAFLGLENISDNLTRPYYDSSIAIGYGFDLIQHSAAEITSYLNRVNNALGLQGNQRVTLSQHDINRLNEARTATPTRRDQISRQLDLTFPSSDYAESLRDIVVGDFETALNNSLGGAEQLLQSKERIAVISVLYNLGSAPSTIKAIKNDNRAEAWYEIRYNSNNGNQSFDVKQGLAVRHYKESNLFDLYDSGTPTMDEQAAQDKEIMRMYMLHKTDITNYEQSHPAPSSIDSQIQEAKNYLITFFADRNPIDNVIVGKGLSTYEYLDGESDDSNLASTEQNDLIFGEKGNDIINGGVGNDVIYGGKDWDVIYGGGGDDTLIGGDNKLIDDEIGDWLYGGEGSDTYYADNQDIIDDTVGDNSGGAVVNQGKVYFEGIQLKNGTKLQNSDDFYVGDGGIYTLEGTTLTFKKNGKTLTINNYRKKGDLSIDLNDDNGNSVPGVIPKAAKASGGQPRRDPLILDLNGDGIKTTGLYEGTYFDQDGNGFAELTAWVDPNDGLLVMDKNGNGTIDNGNELFSDQTLLTNGRKATSGFQALAELDTNADGKIDANDTSFLQLKVWQDTDGDGSSSSDELSTLDALGITAVNLNYTSINITDANGNILAQSGTLEGWVGAEKSKKYLDIPSIYL